MGDFLDDIIGLDPSGGGATAVLDPTGAIRDISGISGAFAAEQGAKIQEDAGQRAITVSDEAQRRLEGLLAPFGDFGTDLIPQAQRLFGPTAGASIASDPALVALQDEAERRILAGQAARGRVDAGETAPMLQDAFLRTGADLLSRQRGDLLSALGLGQASAAQTGVSGIGTAGRTGDLLSQIANAQSAGLIGAQGAKSQGLSNILSLGSAGLTGFGGAPSFGGGGSIGSGPNINKGF